MKKQLLIPVAAVLCSFVSAAEIAGTPRDSNNGNTGGYDGTRVEAQLLVNVKDDVNAVHFVRDNNDPRVITKTYILKNVDPYEFRDYLRQMVQSKRVGNTNIQQQYLEIDPLLMGFGLERDTIHSPNESYLLKQLFAGMEAIALFYRYY